MDMVHATDPQYGVEECVAYVCRAVGACPSPTAHRRLDDAHRLLHECLAHYLEPGAFRTFFNALVPALRNITFVVQKEIAAIDGGGDWYASWQDTLRADPFMKWVVDARNRVVKEGDLDHRSVTSAYVVGDYFAVAELVARTIDERMLKEVEAVEVEVAATASLDDILARAERQFTETGAKEYATLFVERRWEVPELPDAEVLYVAGHALAALALLVADMDVQLSGARDQPDLDPARLADRHHYEWVVDSFRPECMFDSRRRRTGVFAIGDGQATPRPVEPALSFDGMRLVAEDQEGRARAVERYGAPVPATGLPRSLRVLADLYERSARRILATGDEHGWFAFFIRGARLVHVELLISSGNEDKWELAMRIAQIAELKHADVLVMIGEAWMGDMPADGEALVRPGDQPERREVLSIVATNATGESHHRHIPFRRSAFGTLDIGATVIEDSAESFFLAPVRAMWRKRVVGRGLS